MHTVKENSQVTKLGLTVEINFVASKALITRSLINFQISVTNN